MIICYYYYYYYYCYLSYLGPSTLHCSVDGLELFSCCVSQEDDTALSILDPVSIGVELKPLDTPSKDGGTHTLEVS